MADFNDFLNTQSDPMNNVLGTNRTSNIQQGADIEKPNKADLSSLRQEQSNSPEDTVIESRLPKNIPAESQEDSYIIGFGKKIKELKIDDINNVKPDYDTINQSDFANNADYVQAQARTDYDALKKQIEQDNKYYQSGDGNQYSSKLGDKYSSAMIDNVKDEKFDWDKYMMLNRYEKPIYTYGKESWLRSAIKGTVSFGTGLGTSLARATKLPFDIAEGVAKTSALDSKGWEYGADVYYGVDENDSYLSKLNKVMGEELATTTRAFKSVNDSLNIELGVNYDDRTNKAPYMIGNLAGNIGINFLSLGAGALAKTVQGANALRMAASNLTVAAYGAAAFQDYSLNAMAAGKDPMKAHAAGVVNGVLQSIIEKYSFEVQARHLGAGSYRSAVDVMKNYKNIDKDVFIKSLYKNSLLASSITEGSEEVLQDLVETGLQIFQGINEKTAAEILEDMACDFAMGAVLTLPMAHVAANGMTKLRNRIAENFSNLSEKDANALATVFLVYSEEVANNPEFQKEYLNVLRDNILNLKPTDAGQDTNPLATNGIVQELEESKPSMPGETVLDTMINNKNNLRESLFDLITNPARKEELDKTMMDVSKQVKKYATTYMGQTDEEASLTSKLVQEQIFAIATTTDMSAKQIFNAIMPKIHNRATVSALTNYKSNSKATQDTLLKYSYNSKESSEVFKNKVDFIKNIIDNDKSLERITQLKMGEKTDELSEFERVSSELKAAVQRETAIQQQIRKIKGQPLDYNIARDIAIYKLLGVSERSLVKFIDNRYVINGELNYRDKRTKHLLSSIDTTNDDFLGYESARASKLSDTVKEEGAEKAVEDEVDNMIAYKQGSIYANRARDIIDTIKKNKNYKITKQDADVINRALQLADMSMGDGLFGMYTSTPSINPMIILDRLATGDVTVHEFSHHIIEQVITMNNVMAKHTGYHFVYFNNLINCLNNILKVQGYKGGMVNEDGTLNVEAHEMLANILEDYITGRLAFDSIDYSDSDREALSSILDSYNNLILKSSNTTFNTFNDAGIYRPNKPVADELAKTALLRRSAYSRLSLSAYLTKELDDVLKAENMDTKEALSRIKAVFNVAMEMKLLSKPSETAYLMRVVSDRVTKKKPINLLASADGDLYIVLTNLYTDINKNTIDSIVTTAGPDVDIKSNDALNSRKKDNAIMLPAEIREQIESLAQEKIEERVKANAQKYPEEKVRILRQYITSDNPLVNNIKQKIFEDIYNKNKKIIKKLDRLAYVDNAISMMESDLKESEKNFAENKISQEDLDWDRNRIQKAIKDFKKKHAKEYDNKNFEDIRKEIRDYVSGFKGITEEDKNIFSLELTRQIIKDYSKRNRQEFFDEYDAEVNKDIQQATSKEEDESLSPKSEADIQAEEEQKLASRKINVYSEADSEENQAALDKFIDELMDATDRENSERTGETFNSRNEIKSRSSNYGNLFNEVFTQELLAAKERISSENKKDYSADTEQQDGDPNYDISGLVEQVRRQNRHKGNTDKDIKPTIEELDLGVKNKKVTQAEKYAIVQDAIEKMATPLGKGKDILSMTEREVMSQDVVNEGSVKDIVDYQKSLSVKIREKVLELNRKIEDFCGINTIKSLARGWESFKVHFAMTSVRLDDVSSKFKSDKKILPGLRYAVYRSDQKYNSYVKVANTFLDKFKEKLNAKDNLQEYETFVSALMTDDAKYRQQALEIANKYGFVNELNDLFLVFEECKNLRIKRGMFRKGREYYFPRQVRDVKGLLKEIVSDPTEPLAKILIEKGYNVDKIEVTDENELLGLYNAVVKRDLSHNKQRVIQVMKPKYLQYYSQIGDALQTYFLEQKDLIMKDVFFNNLKITESQLVRVHDAYLKCPYNTSEGWYDILRQLGYLDKTNDYNNKNNKIIASYVDSIFFREASTRGLKAYREFTSMTLISNPISALENFKDIGNIVAQYGFAATLRNFASANNDMKKEILKENKDIKEYTLMEDLARKTINDEFRDMQYQGLSNWSEKCRKISGFLYLDSLNKITFMRTTLESYKSRLTRGNKETQKQTIDEIYKIANNNEEFANEIIAALQQDMDDMRSSDAIKFFLWYKMSENYPLSMLEMPKAYNLKNWTRFFYNFKMQPLKIANRVVYQYKHKFENAKTWKEKSEILAELIKVLMYYAVCGIPVDYIKDIIRGVPTNTLPEYAAYSVASNFLLSEYVVNSIKDDGALKGVWAGLMPAEPVTRLLSSNALSVIPVAGPVANAILHF